MADAHELLDGFLAAEPPAQITNALMAFLSAPRPFVHHASWIPPADEVATRQDLAQQLRQNIMAADDREEFDFTAMQMAALLLMPIEKLRSLVEKTGHHVHWDDRLESVLSLLAHLETMRDGVRYCTCFLLSPSLECSGPSH